MEQVKILFLDIDGCLNSHKPFPNGYCGSEWSCVEQLNRILEAVPDCMIVLTSAWRYLILGSHMTLEGFENLLLTHGVDCRKRLLDTTCSDETERGRDRGKQISAWLDRNGHKRMYKYVVIDDGGTEGGVPGAPWTDLGIDAANHPVVWTDGSIGLTEFDADRAIAILKAGERASDGF